MNQPPTKGFAPVLVATAIATSVATLAATSLAFMLARPSSAPTATAPAADLAPIVSRLDDLSRRLDEVATLQRGSSSVRSEVARDGVATLDSGLPSAQLAQEVRDALRAAGAQNVGEVRRDTPQNWSDLLALHARSTSDPDATNGEVRLLTIPELIRRFGMPSRMEPSDGELFLSYDHPGPDGEPDGHVAFYLTAGYVWRVDTHFQ